MLALHTLGSLDLRDPEGGRSLTAVLSQPKPLALLAYLVLARPSGYHQRNTLLGLFWPELPEARARHALRQALYRLRVALGEEVLLSRGDGEVGVDARRLWCDAVAFEDELDRGDPQRALEHYGGELLPDFAVARCPDFTDWLDRRRAGLRRRAVDAALATSGDSARGWLERAADWAPHDEAAARALMQALAAEGEVARAVQVYESFAMRLQRELSLQSSQGTAELAALIRTGRATSSFGQSGRGTGAAAGPAHRSAPGARLSARAAVVILAAAGAIVVATRSPTPDRPGGAPPALSATRVLVVAHLEPAGGGDDAVLARMATDWIAQGLASTGMIEVVPGSMLLGDDLLAEEARIAVATQAGAGSIVSGTVYRQGGGLVFQARLTTATGAVLQVVEHRASPDEPVVDSVDRLRERVAGALAAALDVRLAAWAGAASQPPSFEAYRRFTDGMDLFTHRPSPDYRAAAERFLTAASLDEGFTAPLIWAVTAYMYAHDFPLADSLARTLEPVRDRLAAWDRAMLDRHLAHLRHDLPAAYAAMRRVVRIAPASEWRRELAVEAIAIGRPQEALGIVLTLDPGEGWLRDFPLYWITRLDARHLAGSFQSEMDDVDLIRRRPGRGTPSAAAVLPIELRALAALGRTNEWDARLAEHAALLTPTQRAGTSYAIARELRAHGFEAAASSMLARALAAYDSMAASGQGPQGPDRLGYAYLLLSHGRLEEARRLAEALLAEQPRKAAFLGLLGAITALEGDVAEAERLAAEIERHGSRFHFGEDELQRACILVHLDDRDGAVRLVREAFARGLSFSMNLHVHECLHPLRGYAPYEALIRPHG
jgi:DNA-binding SARP family transcriptional activator